MRWRLKRRKNYEVIYKSGGYKQKRRLLAKSPAAIHATEENNNY